MEEKRDEFLKLDILLEAGFFLGGGDSRECLNLNVFHKRTSYDDRR